MKTIVIDILDRLSTIEGLRYADKDWGQLELEQPAVKFPCALIDIDSVVYSNRANDRVQMADGVLSVKVASLRLSNSNAKAPTTQREQSFACLDMVRTINEQLHLWHTERFSKLIRTSLTKVECAPGYDCYTLRYHLTWWDEIGVEV